MARCAGTLVLLVLATTCGGCSTRDPGRDDVFRPPDTGLDATLLDVRLDSPSVSDGPAAASDWYAIQCGSVDWGYEQCLCTTNIPYSTVSQCPTTAPIKCPGIWVCDSGWCKYRYRPPVDGSLPE